MKRLIPLFLFALMLYPFAEAQVQEQYWPVEFGNPDSVDFVSDETIDTSVVPEEEEPPEAPDSSTVVLTGKTALYQTVRAHSTLEWEKILPKGHLDQTASYQYSQQASQSSIQTVDGTGNILFYNVRSSPFNAGLIWTPIVSYSKKTIESDAGTRTVGALQSSADLGPVLSGSFRGIPFTVKGGLYGFTWNDSITPWLLSSTDGRYHASPGVFGGFDCGGEEAPFDSVPLWFSLNTMGRSVGGNNLGLLRTGVLYTNETRVLGGGDSIYLSIGDSITNGKELYIGDFGGNSFYSNTSWRINHSFSGSAALRFKERFATIVRSYYRYGLHSISYPNESSGENDIRTTSQILGFSARTRKNLPISYDGGIEFGWEFDDYMYKRSFGTNDSPTAAERDAYIINQSDHYTGKARTDNDFTIRLPAGFRVNYHLAAAKDSKRYPFVFRETLTIKRTNVNENDRVWTDHLLSLFYERDSSLSAGLYGKYRRTYLYYYHENRAGESSITDEYRTGINVRGTLGPVSLREHFYMDVEISDNYFKKIGDKPTDPPPYARRFSSSLSGTWAISDSFSLNGNWVNIYSDDGYWYGKAYHIDTSAGDAEFYAIESKSTKYWIDCWLRYGLGNGTAVSIGSKFSDVFERRYDFDLRRFRNSELDVGYDIEPYVRTSLAFGTCRAALSVRRIFKTEDAERWSKRKNWDISLSMQVYW